MFYTLHVVESLRYDSVLIKETFAVARCLSVRPSVCHVGVLYPHG